METLMKRITLVLAVLLVGTLAATSGFAASSGTSAVTLAASANEVLQVLDNTFTLTPNATDYANDYVEALGASSVRVRLKSNSITGVVLYVKCTDASPQIALADFLVKTQTAAGVGGSTMSSFTAVTAANQALWSTSVAQVTFQQVNTDIRVQNLFAYPDAITAGTTSYTDNLTFTAISQ
jgi:hypothetical protein